jgi:hypothetical protein
MNLFIKEKIIEVELALLRRRHFEMEKYIIKLKTNLFKKHNIKIPFSFFYQIKNDNNFRYASYDYSRAYVVFGIIGGKPQLLAFNERYLASYKKEEIKNIMLHEIAHAKLSWRVNFEDGIAGHSLRWWKMFLKIGGRQDIVGGQNYY